MPALNDIRLRLQRIATLSRAAHPDPPHGADGRFYSAGTVGGHDPVARDESLHPRSAATGEHVGGRGYQLHRESAHLKESLGKLKALGQERPDALRIATWRGHQGYAAITGHRDDLEAQLRAMGRPPYPVVRELQSLYALYQQRLGMAGSRSGAHFSKIVPAQSASAARMRRESARITSYLARYGFSAQVKPQERGNLLSPAARADLTAAVDAGIAQEQPAAKRVATAETERAHYQPPHGKDGRFYSSGAASGKNASEHTFNYSKIGDRVILHPYEHPNRNGMFRGGRYAMPSDREHSQHIKDLEKQNPVFKELMRKGEVEAKAPNGDRILIRRHQGNEFGLTVYDWYHAKSGEPYTTDTEHRGLMAGEDTVFHWVRGMTLLSAQKSSVVGGSKMAGAKAAAPRKTAEQRTAEHAAAVAQALTDWKSGRAYIDNAGNYRIHQGDEKFLGHYSGKSVIAPWNKAARLEFPTTDLLHAAAQQEHYTPHITYGGTKKASAKAKRFLISDYLAQQRACILRHTA